MELISLDYLERKERSARFQKIRSQGLLIFYAIIGAYFVLNALTFAGLVGNSSGGEYVAWVHWPLKAIIHAAKFLVDLF